MLVIAPKVFVIISTYFFAINIAFFVFHSYNHVILEKIKVIKLISSPKRVNITLPEDQYQNFEKSFSKYRNPKHA